MTAHSRATEAPHILKLQKAKRFAFFVTLCDGTDLSRYCAIRLKLRVSQCGGNYDSRAEYV